jgi:cytochrome P450 family 9
MSFLIFHADDEMLVLELKDLYTRYTTDVIATAAFGIGIDSFKNPKNEFYKMGQKAFKIGHLRKMKSFGYLISPNLMQVRFHIYITISQNIFFYS